MKLKNSSRFRGRTATRQETTKRIIIKKKAATMMKKKIGTDAAAIVILCSTATTMIDEGLSQTLETNLRTEVELVKAMIIRTN